MLFFVLSLAGLAVVVAPFLSIVGFLRGRAMRRQLEGLTADIAALRAQVSMLTARIAAAEQRNATDIARAGASPTAAPEATVTPPPPVAITPTSRPAGAPDPAAAYPLPTERPVVPPLPALQSSNATATAPSTAERVHSGPGNPPAPAPVPAAPAFDWESLLGVRGAAWLGGVTLVIAALFFASWGIEQGFFSPVIRVGLLLVSGAAALLWAELKLRGGFATTANAVSGAGVVTLYAGFFAGSSLYQLFSLTVAFAGMSAVTVLAGAIAVRFGAQFTALIGLAGGLATPVLLSSGVDRPVAFFSYLALLAAGFLHAAGRRRWPAVTVLALVGTSMLQAAWYASWMTSAKVPVGAASFIVIGAVYLWHAIRTADLPSRLQRGAAITGALLPLGFNVLMAADATVAGRWPVLLAALVIVDVGLILGRVAHGVPVLAGGAGVATAIVAAQLGARHGEVATSPSALVVAVIAIAGAFHLVPRLTAGRGDRELSRDEVRLISAAILFGLVGFAWNATHGGQLPWWAFLAVICTAFAMAVDRTRGGAWPGALVIAVFGIAWACREWVLTVATPESFARHLMVPYLCAAAAAIVAAARARKGSGPPTGTWYRADHAAAVVATFVAYLGALAGLETSGGISPWSFFLLIGVQTAILVGVALQAAWPRLVPAAATLSLLFSGAWHIVHFAPATSAPALTAYTATYLFFVVLPFLAVRQLPLWKAHPAPWLASALVGPATFPLYYAAWREILGTGVLGVVPIVMAGISVAALYGIDREFGVTDGPEAKRRLDYLALFAAIALGFIAIAVPLQLERQWFTIAWAVEAAAVWWLFGRLPHPGLKYFGLLLFLAVGVRLLANPDVLAYEPRGVAIFNWLLYTYGVPASCCLGGAYLLRAAERRRGPEPAFDLLGRDRDLPVPTVGFLGLLLFFWLINLEIADYYSAGRYVEFDLTRHLARDLTRSCAWGLYALALLGVGFWRGNRGLRLVSLGFLLLTVAKVFLYDLGQLTGLYRIVSFLALGLSLILVSLLYQRFVRPSEKPARG